MLTRFAKSTRSTNDVDEVKEVGEVEDLDKINQANEVCNYTEVGKNNKVDEINPAKEVTSGFCTCRFSRSSEARVPVGWTRVSEGLGSRLLSDGEAVVTLVVFPGELFFRADGFLRLLGLHLFGRRRG